MPVSHLSEGIKDLGSGARLGAAEPRPGRSRPRHLGHGKRRSQFLTSLSTFFPTEIRRPAGRKEPLKGTTGLLI